MRFAVVIPSLLFAAASVLPARADKNLPPEPAAPVEATPAKPLTPKEAAAIKEPGAPEAITPAASVTATAVRKDSPEPVSPEATPAPVASSAEASKSAVRPVEATPTTAAAEASAGPKPLPASRSRTSSLWDNGNAARVKLSTQTHTGVYVNRVRFLIPAGVKVIVRKDWYAKDIVVEYPANPYTDWKGVTPLAFAFKRSGSTLEVTHVTPKYLPQELRITVPTAVEVFAE